MKISNLFCNKLLPACFGMVVLFHSTSTAQFKLYSTGSLSIGSITQPPANAELQVIGNTLFSKNTGAIVSSSYIKASNNFSTDSLPDYTWWGDTLTGIFHPAINAIAFSNSGIETMRLSNTNNVLFGTTTDNGDRMQVTGALNKNPFDIYSNYTVSYGYSGINWVNDTNTKAWAVKYNNQDKFYVYGNGQAFSYGWNTLSDSNLKENVCAIPNALDKVLKLQGVTYNLKQSATAESKGPSQYDPTSRKMGLIAQAVERVAPEVVSTTSDGMKTVAYGNLVGLLIEAIKQEDSKINILQRKLDSCIALKQNPDKDISKDNTMGNADQPRLYPCKNCPVSENTSIRCYIPMGSTDASLMVFDINGALKKTIPITGKNDQYVSIQDKNLTAGMYYYSLFVNGREVATKKIILTD